MLNMYEVSGQISMGKTIFDIPLRVVYYGRVSSKRDAQMNSLDNQEQFFKDYIGKVPNWTLVDSYIDGGIRGESVEKRTEFLRMIRESKQDKFDFILTKEISRFARNTLDSLKYTRELFRSNVGVYFITDNICTVSGEGEMRLAILSSIYQDEARKLSSRIKFGDKESIKKGVVFGNSRIYGYDKSDGKLVINETEAEMVRKIFNWYVNEDLSTSKIEKKLYEDGYRSRTGGKIAHVTIGSILKNPKYKGYYCGHKVVIDDYMTQKQRFLPENEWIMWKDETGETVPQIIDESLWEAAYQKYIARSKVVKDNVNHNGGYGRNLWGKRPLSNKIFCTHCGRPYWRDVVAGVGKNTAGKEYWKCSGKKVNGTKSCNSINLYNDDIELMLKSVIKDIEPLNQEALTEFLDITEKALSSSADNEKKITSSQKLIEKNNRKKELLLELYSEENITKKEYLDQTTKLNNEIKDAQNIIEKYKDLENELKNTKIRIQKLGEKLKELKNKKDYSLQAIIPFIDRIDVSPLNENNEMSATIVLYDGTSKDITCNSKSSGHIILTI